MIRPAFLDQEPPAGYIAGVGRGATGFSTRGGTTGKIPKRLQDTSTGGPADLHKGLLQDNLNEEEIEAEQVFAAVDAKLSGRSKKNSSSKIESAEGHISQQFADLKRSLADVTEEEWLNIPEAGDITKRHKRERLHDQLNRKEYVAPDSLVQSNVNLTKLTEEREKLLVSQLDSNLLDRNRVDVAELAETRTYLNELEISARSNIAPNMEQKEDLQKMREILTSYRKVDPMRPEGWIASARLEEKAGKFNTAKSIIEEGCQKCPRNDDIWLENLRLNSADIPMCKSMIVEALRFNPESSSLWLKAVDLETETFNKCRVIRKALQVTPHSEELWKLIVLYENDKSESEKIVLKAVEFVPQSIELWKSLIHIQNYTDAKKSLNKARKLLPTEFQIWILAAQLEERSNAQVTVERLVKILSKGVQDLKKHGVAIPPTEWLAKAQELQDMGDYPKAAESLVVTPLQDNGNEVVEEEMAEFIESMQDNYIKIIAFRVLISKKPMEYKYWRCLRSTCEKSGRMAELYKTFETVLFDGKDNFAVVKKNPVLSLMYSKELWKYGKDSTKALEIIEKTLQIVPEALDVWLAKIKILCFSSSFDRAEETFVEALKNFETSDTANLQRLYYKYVSFLRFEGQNSKALSFIEGICQPKFPHCHIFQIQKGQILRDIGELEKCREVLSVGTKKFTSCAILWILLAQVDEKDFGKPTKARSDLDLAVLKNPKQESLYLAKIALEKRQGNYDQARLIVAQALQKFPKSPKLWSENIRLLPSKKSSLKKTMFQDALRNTNNSCQVLIEIGVSFYQDSQYATASKWFERATKSSKLYGDGWVWLTRCLEKLNKNYDYCYEKVADHEPIYGEEWISISKNIQTQYSTPSEILGILVRHNQI